MTPPLKPMDVYGDITVPFDVAAYCRGHKFSTAAVALTRAINERNQARAAVAAAEKWLTAQEAAMNAAIEVARKKMEESPNV